MIFQVRRDKGPDKPQNGCEDVDVDRRGMLTPYSPAISTR